MCCLFVSLRTLKTSHWLCNFFRLAEQKQFKSCSQSSNLRRAQKSESVKALKLILVVRQQLLMLSFHLHYWSILSSDDNHRFIIRFIQLAAKRFSCGKYETISREEAFSNGVDCEKAPMKSSLTVSSPRLKNNIESVADESVPTS